jgi:hypothetical protein
MIYEKKPLTPSNDDPHCQSIFAQLVSSSFKNQEKKTKLLHYKGYKFLSASAFFRYKGFLETLPDLIKEKINTSKYTRYLFGIKDVLILFVYILGAALHVAAFIFEKIFEVLDTIDPFDFFEPKLPKSRKFFGWKDPTAFGVGVNSLNLRIPDPNNIKFERRLLTTPTILSISDTKKVANFKLPEPHWRYQIDFILAENETRMDHVNVNLPVSFSAVTSKNKALEEYLKASKNHMDYAQKHGSGKEIVGLNNVSEVSFNWKDGEKSVLQQTWWHLKRKDKKEPEQFFPLTKYKVSLEFNEEDLPSLN